MNSVRLMRVIMKSTIYLAKLNFPFFFRVFSWQWIYKIFYLSNLSLFFKVQGWFWTIWIERQNVGECCRSFRKYLTLISISGFWSENRFYPKNFYCKFDLRSTCDIFLWSDLWFRFCFVQFFLFFAKSDCWTF